MATSHTALQHAAAMRGVDVRGADVRGVEIRGAEVHGGLLARPWPGVQTRFESTCVLPLVPAAVTVAVVAHAVVTVVTAVAA